MFTTCKSLSRTSTGMRAKAREGSIDKYESLDSRERQLYEEDILAIHVLRYVGNVTGTRTGLTTILTGMTMTSGECEDSPSPHIGRYLSYSMICLCADTFVTFDSFLFYDIRSICVTVPGARARDVHHLQVKYMIRFHCSFFHYFVDIFGRPVCS